MTPNDVGARLSGFGHRWFPVTVQHSWPGWEELSMVRWLACGLASVVLTVVPGWTTVPGTGWHDDPDGDGVPSATDLCPAVYDPLQTDGDLDGVGDACSRPTPTLGGPITDLRVEHVTPFGAWVNLTSPHDDEYGWDVTVVWSTDPTELTTFAGFSAAYHRGDRVEIGTEARFGEPLEGPIWITALEPDTAYWLAAAKVNWDGLDTQITAPIPILTPPAAQPSPEATRPRVFVTSADVVDLQQLHASGDPRWSTWEGLMRAETGAAAADPDGFYRARDYCTSAALLHRVTGDAQDLADALVLFDENVAYWEAGPVDGNQYRWEDAQLALCLDLLWDDLDPATRNQAAAAFLDDDERHIADGGPRPADTDEYASTVRTWIVHGLTLCGATGVDAAIADRSCTVLAEGLRLWEGVQLVKARRDEGVWAQSGGFLPDGTDYGQGTATYWFHAALALANAGVSLDDVAPFLRHVILAEVVHLLTPAGGGYATAGDVEDFSYNFGVEPHSFQLETADAGLLALAAGVFAKAGDAVSSAWTLGFVRSVYPDESDVGGFFRLLFDAGTSPLLDHRLVLPPTFFDSGMDVLYDRTSWSTGASFLMMRAGWDGADHSHGDIGHFQLYRRGRWITHEAIGYDGPAATGAGHNVPLLALSDTDIDGDQFHLEPVGSLSGTRRVSSSRSYAYLAADLRGAYTSYHGDSRLWDLVQRQLLWLKDADETGDDVIVIFDRIEPAATTPPMAVRRIPIHVDEAPAIAGTTATVNVGDQRLEVTALLPTDAVLTAAIPDGPPDEYPADVYTHRVFSTPADPSVCDRFLTVLRASDGTSPAVTPQRIDAPGLHAALIGHRVVVLPEDPIDGDGGPLAQLSLTVPVDAPIEVFLTGLTPGASFDCATEIQPGSVDITVVPGTAFTTDDAGVLAVAVEADGSVAYLDPQPVFYDGFETGNLISWTR
jgi:hypothetical protein